MRAKNGTTTLAENVGGVLSKNVRSPVDITSDTLG